LSSIPDVAETKRALLSRLAATVALDGYHVVAVPADHAPALAYTVGLRTTADHPELVAEGLEPPVAAQLLHLLARGVVAGERFAAGCRRTDLLPHVALAFDEVDAAADRLRVAALFHAPGGFAALRVAWADPAAERREAAGVATPPPAPVPPA
jgi:hypothetical protein